MGLCCVGGLYLILLPAVFSLLCHHFGVRLAEAPAPCVGREGDAGDAGPSEDPPTAEHRRNAQP